MLKWYYTIRCQRSLSGRGNSMGQRSKEQHRITFKHILNNWSHYRVLIKATWVHGWNGDNRCTFIMLTSRQIHKCTHLNTHELSIHVQHLDSLDLHAMITIQSFLWPVLTHWSAHWCALTWTPNSALLAFCLKQSRKKKNKKKNGSKPPKFDARARTAITAKNVFTSF